MLFRAQTQHVALKFSLKNSLRYTPFNPIIKLLLTYLEPFE